AVTKLVNELYGDVFSKIYGYHSTGLRYFNVFGPRQNPNGAYAAVIPLFIRAALNNDMPTINGDGFTNRDFTFIDNVVQANIKALFQPGVTQHNVFNIACGEQTNLNELWQYLSDLAGTCTAAIYAPERTGDVRQSLASIEKASVLLRYMPEIQVKEGLKLTYEWYKKNENSKQLA
ncbi:MAG: NAD-dependent epimerase/dehydratase family protein, partial [Mucilaginibacter sp.]